jgi:hypothetical protein
MPRKNAEVKDQVAEEHLAAAPDDPLERPACTPVAVSKEKFNLEAVLPYGLSLQHVYNAMNEFVSFLGFINQQLNSKNLQRFESMLMRGNFSSMVGEFMTTTLPKTLWNSRQECLS